MKRKRLALVGSPRIESILAVPSQGQVHSSVTPDSNNCVDCYDCDYNCEECDNCDGDK